MNTKTTRHADTGDNEYPIASTQASRRDIADCMEQEIGAHNAFLNMRHAAQSKIAELIALQLRVGSEMPMPALTHGEPDNSGVVISPDFGNKDHYVYPPLMLKENFSKPAKILWDHPALVELAEGKVANVFGEEYAVIDTYRRRVRLPANDYLLVTRVTDLDAKLNEFRKSYVCTEYDLALDAPYLVDGQIPWCIVTESGQSALFLMSYIGADFLMKGERVYRMLDCDITFHEKMPYGGQTLRYDIYVNSFAWNGDTLVLFFTYDGYVGDKKIMTLRNGSAGLFSDAELTGGKGVVDSPLDKLEIAKAVKTSFTPLIHRDSERAYFGYDAMMKLVHGDIAGCFGPQYDQHGRNPSLRLATEKFLMLHRVTHIDESAGHWGLGVVEGEKDLAPDEWFFLAHFKNDHVMPGSLMAEGCWQLMMFYMLSLGMHSQINNGRFQPLTEEPQKLRCRGQVEQQRGMLKYRLEAIAIGLQPYPHLKANVRVFLDGKPIMDFKNVGMKIVEQDENSPYAVQLPDNVQRV